MPLTGYSTEAGVYNVFDSHARDMYHNSHSEGTCVLLEIPFMHKLVKHFQSLYGNEDIYELMVYILPTLKLTFFQSVLNKYMQERIKATEKASPIHTLFHR